MNTLRRLIRDRSALLGLIIIAAAAAGGGVRLAARDLSAGCHQLRPAASPAAAGQHLLVRHRPHGRRHLQPAAVRRAPDHPDRRGGDVGLGADRRAGGPGRRLLHQPRQRSADAHLRHLPRGAADRAGDRHRADARSGDPERDPGALHHLLAVLGTAGLRRDAQREERGVHRGGDRAWRLAAARDGAACAAVDRIIGDRAHDDRHGRHHPGRRGAWASWASARRRPRRSGAA